MRPEKASIVSELSENLKRSPFVLVTDYRGMRVADFSELRNRLAPAGAEIHVIKNNFLKRAMADSGFPDLGDQFGGQTAVVTGQADVAPVAKIFKSFASEFKLALLKVGFVDRAVLSSGGMAHDPERRGYADGRDTDRAPSSLPRVRAAGRESAAPRPGARRRGKEGVWPTE